MNYVIPTDSELLDWLGANTTRRLFFDRSDPREPGCWVVEVPSGTREAPEKTYIGFDNTPRGAIQAAMDFMKSHPNFF